ncbi:MAG: hypothetical protein IH789_13055 [Acidobacteria bacterium]|nr:hypothetical protein [Acidobacteriota bacterium]
MASSNGDTNDNDDGSEIPITGEAFDRASAVALANPASPGPGISSGTTISAFFS